MQVLRILKPNLAQSDVALVELLPRHRQALLQVHQAFLEVIAPLIQETGAVEDQPSNGMVFRKAAKYLKGFLEHAASLLEIPGEDQVLGIIGIGDCVGEVVGSELLLSQLDGRQEELIEISSFLLEDVVLGLDLDQVS